MAADLVRTSYINNDWDLEAIIRGWGGGSGGSACSMAVEEVAVTWKLPPAGLELDGFDTFDRLEATATVLNELEELYKPFLLQPKSCDSYSPYPEGPTSTKATSSSSSPAIFDGCDGGVEEQEVMRPEVVDDHTSTRTASCKPRHLKRKQITRVVHLGVGDDDDDGENNLAKMDQWNWRKYGQKSIKGSPYPRSYYKCSSLGGCRAKKQVEQSMEHPYTLIVTYIGDHVHPFPTKRRSLAGRTLTNSILPQPPLPIDSLST